ncbi:hypothetical protein QBC35DRAFT_251996 [Podospora australis]|uniref:Uncharacterized protein n=1 Tax=Podospora australis TaxID=1536484 RepID=A0AAN6WV10_9PEZI|nr:hypothetical protein QBC35DRAFT_251996 [Podospora australis]
MASAPPVSTPKRKRDQMSINEMSTLGTGATFTFDPDAVAADDGSVSPRSSVAHRFRGLALESGGGVVSGGFGSRNSRSPDLGNVNNGDSSAMDVDMDDGMRKRIKLPTGTMFDFGRPRAPVAEHTTLNPGLRQAHILSSTPAVPKPRSLRFALDEEVVEQTETVANTHHQPGTGDQNHTGATVESAGVGSQQALPFSARQNTTGPSFTLPINTKNKPRNRPAKRAGTPPPPPPEAVVPVSGATTATIVAPVITDPLRASLTWHDDEITIYDPDDSDDDGTGINGIGFKPTAAIAYARTVKRKQQLAEYRKREEREARAQRSQRRGGRLNSPSPLTRDMKGKKAEKRRVRFMESVSVGETVSIEG